MTAETGKKQAGAKRPAKTKDKVALKARLAALKKAREQAKEAKDADRLERIRRDYRRVTHALRRAAPPKPKAAKKE